MVCFCVESYLHVGKQLGIIYDSLIILTGIFRLIQMYPLNLIIKFILNRPFPSYLVPLFQNESKCETFHMKMSSACSFIFMQMEVIFMIMVLHLDSL